MLDWLKNHPLWRWFSELETLISLVECIKIGTGVVIGLVATFWGWLDSQPGSIQFVLFLSACLIAIWVINGALWMQQWHASKKAQNQNDIQTKTQSSLDSLVPNDVQNEPLNLNGRETLSRLLKNPVL
jgi:hypothetical protein